MTKKRDLKKRIRDRQAKTGETYTTARRHVLARRADKPDEEPDGSGANTPGDAPRDDVGDAISDLELTNPGISSGAYGTMADRFGQELAIAAREPRREAIEVDEVIDVSDAAGKLGLACKVLVYERLAKLVDPTHALVAVRDALAATDRDPATALLRAVVAGHAAKMTHREVVLRDPDFMQRIAGGLTAVSKDGRMLAVHVNGYAAMVTVICAAWRQSQTLIMTTPDDRIGSAVAGLGALAGETLFLIYEGRRYPVTSRLFVIGRHPSCDLQIRDGNVSRKHAAIAIQRGAYYIVDLDSHAGIEYRGMKIKNKRIEEGDLFKLHEYVLRFTFHETDA